MNIKFLKFFRTSLSIFLIIIGLFYFVLTIFVFIGSEDLALKSYERHLQFTNDYRQIIKLIAVMFRNLAFQLLFSILSIFIGIKINPKSISKKSNLKIDKIV